VLWPNWCNREWDGSAWVNVNASAPAAGLDVTAVVSGAYSAVLNECVRVDPTGGAFVVTLPTSSGVSGQSVYIKNVSDSVIDVTVSGLGIGETIDGVTTIDMSTGWESLRFVSFDGTWGII